MNFNFIIISALLTAAATSANKSGNEKLAEIMNNIEQSEYTYTNNTKPLRSMFATGLTNPICLGRFMWSSMNPTFDNSKDYFVPQNRQKNIHPSGNVGSVEYVSVGDHGFTGMWATGNKNCLARLSLAVDPGVTSFTPGMAMKCFTDNDSPSANIISMFSLEGQDKNTNFFSNSFSNAISVPKGFLKVLAAKFGLYSSCPIFLSTLQMGEVDAAGNKVTTPKYPVKITLVPTSVSKTLIPSSSKNDFRKDLKELVPIGTELWTVEAKVNGQQQQIGSIRLTSKMMASSYGDEVLFFKHTKGDVDGCNPD
eukprot:Pgem_evm1s16747